MKEKAISLCNTGTTVLFGTTMLVHLDYYIMLCENCIYWK